MRIIAGSLRGRPIVAPQGAATRPTADRVRETLFSMLVSRLGSLDGIAVADLFAGSGAFGFEALSRGAAHVLFVEQAAPALAAIRANARALGVEDKVRVQPGSALALPAGGPFDLIFADPPYAPGSGSDALRAIGDSAWLAPGGWAAIETKRGDAVAGPLEPEAERDVGAARISLFRRPPGPAGS